MASPFKPEELSFLAEEEHVQIRPLFFEPAVLTTLTGNFGPFVPGTSVSVPLWMALKLKGDGKCTIEPPRWMTVEELRKLRTREKTNTGEFMEIPFYYIEISRLLLSGWAREDITNADVVEGLIEDIEQARREKILMGQRAVLTEAATKEIPRLIDLTHASSMEVNMLRATFMKAIDRIVEAGEMQVAKNRSTGGGAGAGAMGTGPRSAGGSSSAFRSTAGTAGSSAAFLSSTAGSAGMGSSSMETGGSMAASSSSSSSSSSYEASGPAVIRPQRLRLRGKQGGGARQASSSDVAAPGAGEEGSGSSVLPPDPTMAMAGSIEGVPAAEESNNADAEAVDIGEEKPGPAKVPRLEEEQGEEE